MNVFDGVQIGKSAYVLTMSPMSAKPRDTKRRDCDDEYQRNYEQQCLQFIHRVTMPLRGHATTLIPHFPSDQSIWCRFRLILI